MGPTPAALPVQGTLFLSILQDAALLAPTLTFLWPRLGGQGQPGARGPEHLLAQPLAGWPGSVSSSLGFSNGAFGEGGMRLAEGWLAQGPTVV